MISHAAALILAGGKSSRLGRDKALLPWQGSSFLATLVANLSTICREVLLVTTPESELALPQARTVHDVIPGKNSLGGLHAGLLHSNHQVNFACACDMPLLLPQLVHGLLDRLGTYDAVVPRAHDRLQPLCAVYTKACLPFIEKQLRGKQLRMTEWLAHARVHVVPEEELRLIDPHLQSFFNVNTEEDYRQLLDKTIAGKTTNDLINFDNLNR